MGIARISRTHENKRLSQISLRYPHYVVVAWLRLADWP